MKICFRFSIFTFLALMAAFSFVPRAVLASSAIVIETVLIDNPGNLADPSTGYGSVPYPFKMAKYKVTISQYVEFLNSVARTQGALSSNGWQVIKGLYKAEMDDADEDPGLLIRRVGDGTDAAPYVYSAHNSIAWGVNAGNRPIPWVTWFDAARFVNWLHNNQRSDGTETGAYTLLNYQVSGYVARNPEARFWIPSENEWYKAAYYDPTKSGNSYWNYPAKSDVPPRIAKVSSSPAAPAANFQNVYKRDPGGVLTPVGAYTTSTSYYGTFDQGGLLWEWTEAAYPDLLAGPNRIVRGGSWGPGVTPLRKTIRRDYGPMGTDPFYYDDDTGFRIAMPAS
jgi:formylglycine-generating enzyme required for sulfatase activity